jgi:uncharacterized membrane protein
MNQVVYEPIFFLFIAIPLVPSSYSSSSARSIFSSTHPDSMTIVVCVAGNQIFVGDSLDVVRLSLCTLFCDAQQLALPTERDGRP